MTVLQLTTHYTAAEIEAPDRENSFTFRIDPNEVDRYSPGDLVNVTSADGYTFIGHLYDVEDDKLQIHVELD